MREKLRYKAAGGQETTPEARESEVQEKDEFSPERESVPAVSFALSRFGSFMLSSKDESAPGLTDEQREELHRIKRKAGASLGKFFKRLKKVALIAPVLAALAGPEGVDVAFDSYIGDRPASTKDNLLDNSPAAARIAEWYFGENLIEIIDEYRGFAEARIDGKMTSEEIAFRERISDNVFPGTQGKLVASGSRSWRLTEFGRLKEQFRNFDEDTQRLSRERLEALPENSTWELWYKQATQIRSDLFRLYLGLSPRFDYLLEEAPYKPTKAKNPNAHYASFPANRMIETMRMVGKGMKESGELTERTTLENEAYAGKSFDAFLKYVEEFETLPVNTYTPSMGRYIVDQGYDQEKGERYVSYYDTWDLDIKAFRLAGIDLDQHNFPFEIYGRIYESDFQ